MEYYITKYALTKGIYKVEGEEDSLKSHIKVEGYMGLYFSGDYFENESNAVIDARRRRKQKIEYLKKQLIKIQDKKFVLSDLTK